MDALTTTTRMMRIDDITVGERHRRDLGDIDGLARSIAEIGLLHFPVVRLMAFSLPVSAALQLTVYWVGPKSRCISLTSMRSSGASSARTRAAKISTPPSWLRFTPHFRPSDRGKFLVETVIFAW